MLFINRIISRFFSKKSGIFFAQIQTLLGFAPTNIRYYEEAFACPTNNRQQPNYQRLEFLGDAILGAVIAHYLFATLERANEGELTQLRSKIVRRDALNRVGQELGLISLLQVKQPQLNKNLNGNLLEALVGAIYLDKGYKAAEKFVHKSLLSPQNLQRIEEEIISYKSILVEWGQKQKIIVHFQATTISTPNHSEPLFEVNIFTDSGMASKATAGSKRRAEEQAAKLFLEQYAIEPSPSAL